jgi:hypothetical protein
MKKTDIYLIAIVLLTFVSSCKKENESTIFYWDETLCSDPWGQDSDDTEEERKESIGNYLSDQKVNVENIEFEFDSTKEQFCEACHCTSGRIIVIEVSTKDKPKMKKLDFYQ